MEPQNTTTSLVSSNMLEWFLSTLTPTPSESREFVKVNMSKIARPPARLNRRHSFGSKKHNKNEYVLPQIRAFRSAKYRRNYPEMLVCQSI